MRNHSVGQNPESERHYVVAFNRDRDGYQLPLALHEAGMLEQLITDYYYPDDGAGIALRRLKHRRVDGLPSRRVSGSARAFLMQAYSRARAKPVSDWSGVVDSALSRKAANTASRTGADLFLYSQYAQEAFCDPRLSGRRKGLFVFHPHYALITELLMRDFERYPICRWSVESERDISDGRLRDRLDAECSLADFILCASSFTKRSLVHHGIDAARIGVVPYGATPSLVSRRMSSPGAPAQFLFVGQGIQRKGLHHLLMAWRAAKLSNAKLRVVCSRLDPGFVSLLDQPGIDASPAVSREELQRLYADAHVFVMPSIVEGFGLVYLEALSAGCYIIATPNTGVPDLALSPSICSQVESGNVGQLTEAIVHAARLHSSRSIEHEKIAAGAGSLSWPDFRRGVIEGLHAFSPSPSANGRAMPVATGSEQ